VVVLVEMVLVAVVVVVIVVFVLAMVVSIRKSTSSVSGGIIDSNSGGFVW
jgi:hypothetical protein